MASCCDQRPSRWADAYLKLEACLVHEALGENFSKLIDGTEENPGEERPDEEGSAVPLEMLPYLLWTQD